MGVVKNENHFTIMGFMVNSLELKGIELMVYAIIYGFSQDGNCKFTGSRQYLADFTGSSKSTIDRVLKELTDRRLIIKETTTENNIIFNKYSINNDRCIQNDDTLFKMSRGCIQNDEGGVFKMTTNNKDINNNSTTNNNINNNIMLEDNYNIYDYLDDNIYNYIESNFGRTLSPVEYEELSAWEDNELTRYAIKQSILNGVYNIKYISTILFNYKKNNIQTVQQAQEEEKRFKEKNQEQKTMTASEKRQEMYKRVEEKYRNGDTRNN